MTDTELLDWLEEQERRTSYGRGWLCQLSDTRGWLLHESEAPKAWPTIRQAIISAAAEEQNRGDNKRREKRQRKGAEKSCPA